MLKYIKKIIKLFLYLLPNIRRKNLIFTTIFSKNNIGGPNRFLYNLEKKFNNNGILIERHILKKCYSALIISYPENDIFFKICKRNNIKTVVRVDGFYLPWIFDNKEHGHKNIKKLTFEKIKINQKIQRALFLSDWVIYQSYYGKKIADKYLFNRISNYSIIYNGVDTNHFTPMKVEKASNFSILALGNWRDIDLMLCTLNTFKVLCESHNDISFRIIGRINPDVQNSIDAWLSENAKIKYSIELVGLKKYSLLPSEINKSDILLHLKSGDNCPNAVIEALSCGLPVVCQKFGGTSEIIGDAGEVIEFEPFLYNESLSKKAANKLIKIINELDYYKNKARERALCNHNIDIVANEYRNILVDYQ